MAWGTMSYFRNSYSDLRLPIGNPGFREAQVAAIQAVGAHFFNSNDPAIVVMPTGSGKTAVLAALAFTLRVERVLVLTPSRLVREQIVDKFSSLEDLKYLNALPVIHPAPKVSAVTARIKTHNEWENLRQFDVVVAVVNSISAILNPIPDPPEDLFDLVVVDEGHHAPAAAWARALNKLSKSKQVLLTATPFRRDEKEIKGRIVFSYDVKRAYLDKVFGDLSFEPVLPSNGENIDVSIALAAEKKVEGDRREGLHHLLMVRVDSISRGNELSKIYQENTSLKLKLVTGNTSLSTVRQTIEKLRKLELDGIICVNMFGEGFDLPNLKIAAVHSPHKSLAITLQFIGRFARTTAKNIGGATFLAEPRRQKNELDELWTSGTPWTEIIANLSSAKIDSETELRKILDSFSFDRVLELSDFSLSTLRPYFHVKIFECPNGVDLTKNIRIPENTKVVFRGSSEEAGAIVFITQVMPRLRWSTDSRIQDTRFDFFVCHYNTKQSLLFICTSRRTSDVYNSIARDVSGDGFRPLSSAVVSRALNDLQGLEFFSVGMRKRQLGGRSESYRIVFGPRADNGVDDEDGNLYDRGHVFGKGWLSGEEVTLGVSPASKVWSNRADQIPELIVWCDELADRIGSGAAKLTGSGIDKLATGSPISKVPAGIVAGLWGLRTFQEAPRISLGTGDLFFDKMSLLDCDIQITKSVLGETHFKLISPRFSWAGIFSMESGDMFSPESPEEAEPIVIRGESELRISDYLSDNPPRFFTEDFDAVEGASIYPAPVAVASIDASDFQAVDWNAVGVNIEQEKRGGGRSIFDWLENRLTSSAADLVFEDDNAGEVADFIAVTGSRDIPVIALYHCKASGKPRAGSRIADFNDVCGQVIRSGAWISGSKLLDRLEERARKQHSRGYIKGTLVDLQAAFAPERRQKIIFEVYIVQPGLSISKRTANVNKLLLGTKSYAVTSSFTKFNVIGSP